jgi:hypothetical protein
MMGMAPVRNPLRAISRGLAAIRLVEPAIVAGSDELVRTEQVVKRSAPFTALGHGDGRAPVAGATVETTAALATR